MDFLKKKRAQEVATWIGKYFESAEKVIDIGAGDCILSCALQEACGIEIYPVDVGDFSRTHLKATVYDGKKLPFPNDSFDTALVFFVLHYVQDPLGVLREARRVARKRIIILQDIVPGPLRAAPTLFWGYLANLGRHSDRPMPYAVSESSLKGLLRDLELRLIVERKFLSPLSLYMINHQLIVAEKVEVSYRGAGELETL